MIEKPRVRKLLDVIELRLERLLGFQGISLETYLE